jgi:hypothetical protein
MNEKDKRTVENLKKLKDELKDVDLFEIIKFKQFF